MKLSCLGFLACAGTAAAYQSSKKCTTQGGSAPNGVPIADGSFSAMGATWAQDFSNDLFDDTGGSLSITVPDTNHGMFVIVSSGTLSVAAASADTYTSSCNNGCGRLLCLSGIDGTLEVDLSDSESTTCADIDLVVGYAAAKTSGNTLAFAKVNACDSNNIVLSTTAAVTTTTTTLAPTTTTDLDAASSTCVAATVLASAAGAMVFNNVL